MSLGVRGMYEAFDIDGYEAIRSRLFAKLRTNLALPEGPPQLAAAPWPARARQSRVLVWVAASIALFVVALLLQFRAVTSRNADELEARLNQRLSSEAPTTPQP